jgi:hypothetical protein
MGRRKEELDRGDVCIRRIKRRFFLRRRTLGETSRKSRGWIANSELAYRPNKHCLHKLRN